MDKDLETNIILHFLNQSDNGFKTIADKYNVSVYFVKKIVNKYWKMKECKHQFYEIDSWTGLQQCRICDKFKS